MNDKGAIWLLSDGRSGSTWFAQLLNFHGDFHVEHEPIHRLFTPQLAGMPLMPLPSERTIDSTYLPLMQAIRDGSYRTNRFGPTPPGADGLIIRDIFALMIAPHILAKCDWLHPVLIVRHPAQVAESKLALDDWVWFQEIESFLADDILRATVPALAGSITGGETPYQRHVLSWAVSHAYFFARMGARRVPVVRYPGNRDRLATQIDAILTPFTANHSTATPAFDAAFDRRSATDRPPKAEPGILTRMTTPKAITKADLAWTEAVIDDFGLRWLVS